MAGSRAKLDVGRDDATNRPTGNLDSWTHNLVYTSKTAEAPNGDGTVTVVGRSFHSDGLDAVM